MAAKIGILGETTVVTYGVLTTVYTVPANKAARVRVLLMLEAHATDDMNIQLEIGTPGTENTWQIYVTSDGKDVITGILRHSTNFMQLSEFGVVEELALNINGNSNNYVSGPFPIDYFLSTGDTVKLDNVGNNDLSDLLCQVQGVEDDA